MADCEVVGCNVDVKKSGHTLCYEHWTERRDGEISTCALCGLLKEGDKPLCYPCFKRKTSGSRIDSEISGAHAVPSGGATLSATDLGEIFGVSAQRLNLVVAELGWVNREHKGWKSTPQGLRVGAIEREARQSGIPYVVWPVELQNNRALIAAISGEPMVEEIYVDKPAAEKPALAQAAVAQAAPLAAKYQDANFRDRYSVGIYCSQDGHRVRSRAELVIDDWLYQHRLVHAYERMLPVDENVVCDFWLPEGRVYIEYWGMDQDADYAARKREKKSIYDKYEMNLVELGDQELKSLEDHLPRLLRKFGVEVD